MTKILSFFTKRDARKHFERMIRPHLAHLYRLSFRFTGKREDAEDLVQDLLIHLFPKVDEMRTIVELKPWLSRCLYNRYIDTCRRAARDPLGLPGGDQSVIEAIEHADKPDQLYYRRQLLCLLDRLDDKDRIVVSLHDVEGYSIREIEAITDMPCGTIKSRLHRARKKLRQKLHVQPSYLEQRFKSMDATGEHYEL